MNDDDVVMHLWTWHESSRWCIDDDGDGVELREHVQPNASESSTWWIMGNREMCSNEWCLGCLCLRFGRFLQIAEFRTFVKRRAFLLVRNGCEVITMRLHSVVGRAFVRVVYFTRHHLGTMG